MLPFYSAHYNFSFLILFTKADGESQLDKNYIFIQFVLHKWLYIWNPGYKPGPKLLFCCCFLIDWSCLSSVFALFCDSALFCDKYVIVTCRSVTLTHFLGWLGLGTADAGYAVKVRVKIKVRVRL